MYVMYKCPECKESVDSNMIKCPACQSFLPDYETFCNIEDGIDQEMYEQMHPIRTKVTRVIDDYLDAYYERGAERRKVKRERSTLYYWWWQAMQLRWAVLIGSAYLALWLTPAYVLMQPSEVADVSWVWFGIVALIPLLVVSMWLKAKEDTRDVTFQQKMIQNAHSAFNTLGYSILLVLAFWYLIFSFTENVLLSLGLI